MPNAANGLGVVDLVLAPVRWSSSCSGPLVAFSVGSWGIIIYKLRHPQARRESQNFTAIFWESKNLATIHTASVGHNHSPVAQVFRAGYQE